MRSTPRITSPVTSVLLIARLFLLRRFPPRAQHAHCGRECSCHALLINKSNSPSFSAPSWPPAWSRCPARHLPLPHPLLRRLVQHWRASFHCFILNHPHFQLPSLHHAAVPAS
ncbi:hypothetical protein B0H11DRAFT_1963100 [Mycena galericulata]|nr:hypothetical protein B0H11DRAFT_1963100 [Mycena galericulata]